MRGKNHVDQSMAPPEKSNLLIKQTANYDVELKTTRTAIWRLFFQFEFIFVFILSLSGQRWRHWLVKIATPIYEYYQYYEYFSRSSSNFNQTKLLRNQNFNQFKWLWIQILIHFRTRRFPLEIFKFESNSNLISIQMTLNSKLNQLKWLWTQILIDSNLIQSQWVLTPSEGLIIWLFY